MMDARDNRLLRLMYRARPYTKAIPFNKALPAVPPAFIELWKPDSAYFEFSKMLIKATVAGIDLNVCDTNIDNPFAFVVPDTAFYTLIELGPSGYRSLQSNNVRVIITNPAGTAATIKGVIYGYEVTREGNYR